ncbi:50S ribosomal protein L21e [archaeon]|nr:50S ribosomal protein L21e [archaeon]
MVRRKEIRTRGKFSFSRYFQRFKEGDNVAVVREVSLVASFPKRLQGRTGVVIGKRGKSYIVKIKDQAKPKDYLIAPVHLKKIKQIEKVQ